jgi:hypothetical protein
MTVADGAFVIYIAARFWLGKYLSIALNCFAAPVHSMTLRTCVPGGTTRRVHQ